MTKKRRVDYKKEKYLSLLTVVIKASLLAFLLFIFEKHIVKVNASDNIKASPIQYAQISTFPSLPNIEYDPINMRIITDPPLSEIGDFIPRDLEISNQNLWEKIADFLKNIFDSLIKDTSPSNPNLPQPQVTPKPTKPKQGNKLYYHIPYYVNSEEDKQEIDMISKSLLADMPEIAKAVKKAGWHDSLIEKYWQDVFAKAVKGGWNPAFVLSIWIEETAASSVCAIAEKRYTDIGKIWAFGIYDFGVLSKPKTYCQDTPAQKQINYKRQLDLFLGLYDFYKKLLKKGLEPLEFEEFLCMYSEGHFPCEFDINPGFLDRLPRVYNCLLDPGNSECPNGYFRF